MPDEFSVNDPKQTWQNQTTEPMNMSLNEIRRRTRTLQNKNRLTALTWITLGFLFCFFFAFHATRTQSIIPRNGFVVLSLWGLYGAYHAYRWLLPRKSVSDATIGNSIDFYRRELEGKRDYSRHVWRRSGLTFCFLGLAMITSPVIVQAFHTPGILLNIIPVLTLLCIWFSAFFYLRKRNRQELQEEIDELNSLQRE